MNKDKLIKVLNEYQAVWYFTKYEGREGIIWGLKSYDDNMHRPTRWIVADNKEIPKYFNIMTKHIRKQGTKFYTNDDDNSDSNVWGYYFNKDQEIDLEPLRLGSMVDLGHTYLFYKNKETGIYKEV